MRVSASHATGRLAGSVLLVASLAAVSGCGDQKDGSAGTEAGGETGTTAQRAREVAAAWDGSPAAGAWRAGYHPMGDVLQPPRGGPRGQADRQAYPHHAFVLRAGLPATWPRNGRVTWAGKEPLTLPLRGASESYKALSDNRAGGRPQLTVTGVRLGDMTLATSRGPAVVPAWLYALEGYDSPLRQAAVIPSKLPRQPIAEARNVPGLPLGHLVRAAADGRLVTVVAVHGACDDGPGVEVLETPGSVVLSASVVNTRTSDGICTKQAKLKEVTVKLARALGDRVLLDVQTGRPVPYKPQYGPSPSWS